MNTVEAMWESYAAFVLGDVPVAGVQYTETRRAFYAGCWAMLQRVKALGDDSVSEDAGVFTPEMLQQELKQFHAEVKAGRK